MNVRINRRVFNKKIILLSQSFVRYKGDITSGYLMQLSEEIQRKGVKVIVTAPHQKGLPFFERIKGVKIFRFQYAPVRYENLAYYGNMHEQVKKGFFSKILFIFFLVSFFLKALEVARREKINLIHAHWWVPSGLVGYFISVLTGRSLIVTCHGTDLALVQKKRFLQPLARLVLRRAKAVTVVSSYLQRILEREIGLPEGNVSVIPMPFEFSTSATPLKREGGGKSILCVARLIPQKRLDVLIDALSHLKQEMDVKLIILGDGPERGNLRRLISELDLEGRVEMPGFIPREELPNYYGKCDLFVLPSVDEGFGLTLAEAMLNRKPVIGTDSGGIPDLIKDGRTGLLFPEGDSRKLAEAMRKILKDDRFAQQLAENGYRYVKGSLSAKRIGERMFAIYKEVWKEKEIGKKRDS